MTFFEWWNQNWPDLAPTQVAMAAWKAGMEEAAKIAEHMAEECQGTAIRNWEPVYVGVAASIRERMKER